MRANMRVCLCHPLQLAQEGCDFLPEVEVTSFKLAESGKLDPAYHQAAIPLLWKCQLCSTLSSSWPAYKTSIVGEKAPSPPASTSLGGEHPEVSGANPGSQAALGEPAPSCLYPRVTCPVLSRAWGIGA